MAEIPHPTALVEAAMAALGASTDDALRDELRRRYGLAPSQGTVNRWRNGKRTGGPSYEYALALLDIAGWLSKGEGRPEAAVAPDDPQAKLAAAVVGLTKGQTKILSELKALRAASEAPPVRPQAPPKRKKTG